MNLTGLLDGVYQFGRDVLQTETGNTYGRLDFGVSVLMFLPFVSLLVAKATSGVSRVIRWFCTEFALWLLKLGYKTRHGIMPPDNIRPPRYSEEVAWWMVLFAATLPPLTFIASFWILVGKA